MILNMADTTPFIIKPGLTQYDELTILTIDGGRPLYLYFNDTEDTGIIYFGPVALCIDPSWNMHFTINVVGSMDATSHEVAYGKVIFSVDPNSVWSANMWFNQNGDPDNTVILNPNS